MKGTRLFSMILTSALLIAVSTQAATKTFDGGPSGTGTALDSNVNWVGDVLPITTDEVLLDNSVITLPTQLTTTGASPTYGDLIWNNNATSSITINTSTSTSRTITLSGGGGSTAAIAAGGASGDLLLMGTTAISNALTIGGNVGTGTGRLNLALGTSGNFDVVNSGATLNLTANISGSGFGFTKTGSGTLTLSGNDTYTGNTVVAAGKLNVTGGGMLNGTTSVITQSGGALYLTTARSRWAATPTACLASATARVEQAR